MSNAKHTPGPWRIGGAHGECIQAPMPSFNFIEFTTKPGYQTILDCRESYMTIGVQPWIRFEPNAFSEMQEANARLIAAAPEMLAALEEATGMIASEWCRLPYDSTHDCGDANCTATKFSRLIAKAKGGV